MFPHFDMLYLHYHLLQNLLLFPLWSFSLSHGLFGSMLVIFHISGVFKIFFVLYFCQKTYSVILIFWNFLRLLALFSTLVNGPVILERNVYSAVLRCSAINVSQIHSVVVHTFTDLTNFFLEKSVKGFSSVHSSVYFFNSGKY